MRTILTKLMLAGAASSLLFGSGLAVAFAEENIDGSVNATVKTRALNVEVRGEVKGETRANASTTVKARGEVEDKAKERADKEIDRRVELLGDLSDRIEAMLKISGDAKASISAMLQEQIDALIALKAKIAAETSTSTLKEDIKSITSSYRTFALVMPKAAITAYADRLNVLASQMTTLGTKLQARIDAASTTDKTVALAAMADFNAKVADAKVQIQAALDLVNPLKPDNGDATVAAANKAALQDAKSKLETARKDLETARKDVSKVRNALPKVEGSASTTASVKDR